MPAGARRWLICALLASLAGAAEPRKLALGLVAPPDDPYSASLLRGARVAAAEGGAGSSVALEIRGDTGQWGSAGNAAANLVGERHVDAIITSADGAATHLILQVSGRTRVPVATLCPDSSVTEAGVPWAVRLVPRSEQQAALLLATARDPGRPPLRWSAVVPTGRAGRVARRELEAVAGTSATRLDPVVGLGEAKADLPGLIQQLVTAAPEGVLLWLPPSQAGVVAAALRQAGFVGRMAGTAFLDSPDFVTAAGTAANGVFVAEFRVPAGSVAHREAFATEFKRKFGTAPDFAAQAAYNAARVLIDTLTRPVTGANAARFPITGPTEGAGGPIHFDTLGNRTDPLEVLACQDGRFIPISPDGK